MRGCNLALGRHRCKIFVGCICSLTAFVASPLLTAAQWPQFGGPRQDFSCEPVELSLEWPEGGPRIIWSRPLGEGYSAISVVGDRLYTIYRDGDEEIVIALHAHSGETIWEHRAREPIDTQHFAARYGYGPRSTPTLVEERVFAVGFNGMLWCLDGDTGRCIWSVQLLERFDAKPTRWGYANSPTPFKKNLLVPVGGKGAAFVSLDQATGRIVWRRHDFENSYGTPILIDMNGHEQAVCLMAREVVGLNPANGDLLWHQPHEGQWLNNIPNPIRGSDDLLFVTSEGNAGSRVLQLLNVNGKASVREVWASRKFRVVHRNVVRMGDTLYGSSGDFGPTVFCAVDVRSGEILWKRRDIGRVGILRVGDRLLMQEESGRIMLATPTPDGITIHAQVDALQEEAWTFPTLVGRRLYLRDQARVLAMELP